MTLNLCLQSALQILINPHNTSVTKVNLISIEQIDKLRNHYPKPYIAALEDLGLSRPILFDTLYYHSSNTKLFSIFLHFQ